MRQLLLPVLLVASSLTACKDLKTDTANSTCLCWGLFVTPDDPAQSESVHDWLIDGGHDCGQELPTNIEETYFVCEEDYTSSGECEDSAVEAVENALKIRDLEIDAECVCLCEA